MIVWKGFPVQGLSSGRATVPSPLRSVGATEGVMPDVLALCGYGLAAGVTSALMPRIAINAVPVTI
jgi:hypothetical protein